MVLVFQDLLDGIFNDISKIIISQFFPQHDGTGLNISRAQLVQGKCVDILDADGTIIEFRELGY